MTTTEQKSAPGRSIKVAAPAAAQQAWVESSPAGKLHLDFDPSKALSSRAGNDLVFKLNNGGTVTVQHFFAVGSLPLPTLELPDGTVVASKDFFAATGMDLTTAAGPTSSSGSSSGGSGSYDDEAGSLIGGVDRMGSLGSDQWGGGKPQHELVGSSDIAAEDDTTVATASTPTPTPTPVAASTPEPAAPTPEPAAPTPAPAPNQPPVFGDAIRANGVALNITEPEEWGAAAVVSVRHILAITDSDNDISELTLTLTLGGKEFTVTAQQPAEIVGEYGTLNISYIDGQFVAEYTFNTETQGNGNRLVDSLGAGEVIGEFEGLTLSVTDPAGNVSDPVPLVVNVTGTNDAPTAQDVTTTVVEQGDVSELASVSGSLAVEGVAADVDNGSMLSFSIDSGDGAYGTIEITDTTTGAYTYKLKPSTESLAAGEKVKDSFDYTVTDEHGATTVKTVTVEIIGTNDAPTANDITTSILEQTGTTFAAISGNLGTQGNVGDVDTGAIQTYSVNTTTGAYGDISSLDPATGNYTYTLKGASEALAVGEFATESFSYTVTDEHGATVTKVLTITITGTNDAPTFNTAIGGSVLSGADTENNLEGAAAYKISGSFVGMDSDASDDLTFGLNAAGSFTATSSAGLAGVTAATFGDLTFINTTAAGDRSGSWSFDATSAAQKAAINAMAEGETVTLNYPVQVTDGHGGAAYETVTITITGSNDAPTFTAASVVVGSMSEAGLEGAAYTITGVLGGLDVDTTDDLTFGTSVRAGDVFSATAPAGVTVGASTFGDLTFTNTAATGDRAGSWSFNASTPAQQAAINALADGETVTLNYPIQVADGYGGFDYKTVTITITGSNDAPTFNTAIGGSVLSGADTENNLEGAAAYKISGSFVGMDSDASDDLTFGLNAAGSFTATSSAGLAGVTAATFGDLTFINTTAAGDRSGSWSFDATSAAQKAAINAMAEGETVTLNYPVQVTDGHGGAAYETVTITITGSNDAPTFTAASVVVGSMSEAGLEGAAYTITGVLGGLDVDTTDDLTFGTSVRAGDVFSATAPAGVTVGASTFGDLTFTNTAATGDRAGSWSFNASTPAQQAAINALADGETVTLNYPIQVADGYGGFDYKTVTITITGSNDAPTFNTAIGGSVLSGADTENNLEGAAAYKISGSFVGMDSDASDDLTFGLNAAGSFTATSSAGLAGVTAATFGDLTFINTTAAGDRSGSWSFDATSAAQKAAINAMAEGETVTLNYPVQVTDGHGGAAYETVTITITGSNDAPTFTAASVVVGSMSEAGLEGAAYTITGVLGGLDVDTTDDLTFGTSVRAGDVFSATAPAGVTVGASTFGDLTFTNTAATGDRAGSWSFNASTPAQQAAINALADGETVTLNYPIQVADGYGGFDYKTVTITITGSNDAPTFNTAIGGSVLSGADTENNLEGAAAYKISGSFVGMDSDASDDLTFGLNAAGSFTATSSAGLAGVTAATFGDLTFINTTAAGDRSGSWSFDATSAAQKAAINAMAEGETVTLNYPVQVTDGHGGAAYETVTITITGSNDAPTFTAASVVVGSMSEAGLEGAAYTITGVLGGLDVDTTDDLTFGTSVRAGDVFSATAPAGVTVGASTFGDLTFTNTAATGDRAGSWSFNASTPAQQAAINALADGETVTLNYPIQVADGYGGFDYKTVTITITGSNDAPTFNTAIGGSVLSGADTENNLEGAAAYKISGSFVGMDSDASDDLTFGLNAAGSFTATSSAGLAGVTAATFGDLTFINTTAAGDRSGSWSFDATSAAQKAAINAMAEGETVTLNYPVQVTDGHGGAAYETVTITITGSNDAPTFTAASVVVGSMSEAGLEGAAYTITGVLGGLDVDTTDDLTFGTSVRAGDVFSATAPAGVTVGASTFGDLTFTNTAATGDRAGSWSFNASTPAQQAAINALADGETVTLNYPIQVADGYGGFDYKTVTITITGSNDAPTFNTAIGGSVLSGADTENNLEGAAAYKISGSFVGMDSDASDDLTFGLNAAGSFTATSSAGLAGVTAATFGDLTFINTTAAGDRSGSWSFDATSAAQKAAINAMAEGETVTLNYPVQVTDGHGGAAYETVTITITGSNDAPTFTAASVVVGSMSEAGLEGAAYTITGVLGGLDVDTTDDLTFGTSVRAGDVFSATAPAGVTVGASTFGDLTFTNTAATGDRAGSWSFNASTPAQQAAINALADGETVTLNYPIQVADGYGGFDYKTVTITITGSNDAPTFNTAIGGSVLSGADTENNLEGAAAYKISGSFVGMDSDASDDLTFGLNAAGSFTATSSAGLAGVTAATFGDLTFINTTAAGDRSGSWSFDATSAAQKAAINAMAEGETVTLNYPVQVTDGHGGAAYETVTITITGSNDAPTFTAASVVVGSMSEAGLEGAAYTITGVLGGLDVDTTDDLTFGTSVRAGDVFSATAPAGVTVGASTFGDLTFTNTAATGDRAGSWSFNASTPAQQAAINALADGETVTLNYPIQVADGYGGFDYKTVTITITGSNDAPTFNTAIGGSVLSGADTENNLEGAAAYKISGSFVGMDSDASDDLTFGLNAAGSFTATSSAGLAGVTAATFGDLTFINTTAAGDRSGSWSFDATSAAQKAAINAMAEGETVTLNYPVQVTDGHGGAAYETVTITITGSNDAPTFTAASVVVGSMSEAGLEGAAYTITGVLGGLDVDTTDDLTFGTSVRAGDVFSATAPAGVTVGASTFGDLTFTNTAATGDRAGSWSFNASTPAQQAAINALADGETVTLNYPIQVADGYGGFDYKTVTITITGTNDAPTAKDFSQNITEQLDPEIIPGFSTVTGNFATLGEVADADSGHTLTYSISGSASGTYGNIVLTNAATGEYSYTLKAISETLSKGQAVSDTFTYTVTDEHGATVSKTVTIDVTGTNDAPEFTQVPNVPSVLEQSLYDATGAHPLEVGYFKAVDIDTNDVLTYSFKDGAQHVLQIDAMAMAGGVLTKIGVYTIDAITGLVTLVPNESARAFTVEDIDAFSRFTVSVFDGTVYVDQAGAVQITGQNDAPIYEGKFDCTIVEAALGVATGTIMAFDPQNYIDPEDNNADFVASKMDISVEYASGMSIHSTDGRLFFHYDPQTDVATWNHVATNAYGELKFDAATGNVVMTLNDQTGGVAHPLPGSFGQDYKVTVTPTDSTGLVGTPGDVTLHIQGSDDTGHFEATPFHHDNTTLVISPFSGVPSNYFTGRVHVGDVDDADDSLLRFAIYDGTDYKTGTWVGTTGEYNLPNGKLTMSWNGTDWEYNYTYTGAPNANNGLVNEKINIRVYDPDKGVYNASGVYDANKPIYDKNDPNSYQESSFVATIITVSPDPNAPKTAFDVMDVKLTSTGTTTTTAFNGDAYNATMGCNVLDNDKDHNGTDGATWSGVAWVKNPLLSLPDVVSTSRVYIGQYGTLTIKADGSSTYTVDKNNLTVRAHGDGDEPLRDTFTYPVKDGTFTTNGTMVVMVTGVNDAPALSTLAVNVTAGWNPENSYGNHPEDNPGLVIIDPDAHDQHQFLFYTDAACTQKLTDIGTTATASYSLPTTGPLADPTLSNFDPDKDGQDGVVVTITGEHIFAGKYGWLVDNGDGTFKYVVNRANADVIKLFSGENLTETFYVKAQEINTSGQLVSVAKPLTVTVKGAHDAPIVKAWGSEANDFSTSKAWETEDGVRMLEFSADHGTRDSQTTPLLGINTHRLVMGTAADNAKTLDGTDPSKVGYSLSGKYLGAANTEQVNLYAAIGENGSIVKIGSLMVYGNGTLTYSYESFEKMWNFRGDVTTLYTDAAGTNSLTGIYAFSSGGPSPSTPSLAGAVTFVPIQQFMIRFGDEAPTVYCNAKQVPVTNGTVDAFGKLEITEPEGETMTISIWDTAIGGYRAITADNTQVTTKHGILTINKDGSYTYDAQDGASGLDDIKVRITEDADPHFAGDVVNTTDSQLNLEVGGYTAQSKIVLKDELVSLSDGRVIEINSDVNAWNKGADGIYRGNSHVFVNDVDENGVALMNKTTLAVNPNVSILNAGVYIFNNMQITTDGHSERPGVATDELATAIKSPVDRLEFSFSLFSLTIDSKGTWSTEIGGNTCQIYDRVTGATLDYTLENAPAVLAWVQANLGVDEATARSYLQVRFPYQVLDARTGDVVEADIVYDLTTMIANHAPTTPSTLTAYNFGGEYDEGASANISAIPLVSERDLNDIQTMKIKYGTDPTVDGTGKLVFNPANQHAIAGTDAAPGTVLDFIAAQGGTFDSATGVVSGNVTLELPVYGVINGVAVQIGVYTARITNLGGLETIGVDGSGNPLQVMGGTTFGNGGTIKLFAPDPNNPADPLWTLANDMKNTHEGTNLTLGTVNIYGLDDGGYSNSATLTGLGGGTLNFAFAGKDIIMGNGAGGTLGSYTATPVFTVNAAENVASDAVKIIEGSKHTVTTARTEVSGWDNFTVDGVTKGNLEADQVWEGRYGYLKWNAGTGKFTYDHYQKSDPNLSHAAAAREVLGMVDGDARAESFTYSMMDKNGEGSGTGKFTVNIAGKNSAFIAPTALSDESVEGTPLFRGDLSDSIYNDDLGFTNRYTINYKGVTYGAQGGTIPIMTDCGLMTFDADTGSYNFTDNGVLKYGEVADMQMTVNMIMGHQVGATFVVDRTSAAVDYHLKITGINNAPEIADKAEVMVGETSRDGAMIWSDVDDTGGFTVTGSHHDTATNTDTAGRVEAQGYTIDGDHGQLVITNIHETGMTYKYTLHEGVGGEGTTDVFTDEIHRVVDSFGLDLHDGGSGTAGEEQTAHATLTYYSVDGAHIEGTSGAETLMGTVGKANVIWSGAGSDHIDLTNSEQDILVWKGTDASLTDIATDTIIGFISGKTDLSSILDVRDLIKEVKGEGETFNDLFTFKVDSGNTTICINDKDSGGASHTIQEIVLDGVTLTASDTAHGTYAELENQIKLLIS